MTTITVRAKTSQKAMEEILRRLGPDALEPKRVKYKRFSR